MGINHQTPPEETAQCVYTTDAHSNGTEYFVYCHPEKVKAWRKGNLWLLVSISVSF